MSHIEESIVNRTLGSHLPRKSPEAYRTPQNSGASGTIDATDRYFALSPEGTKIAVPKELFIALSDFMRTRKCPGSITIEFQCDQIVVVEAVARKTYATRL